MPFAFRRRKNKSHENADTGKSAPVEAVIREKLAGRSLVFIGLMAVEAEYTFWTRLIFGASS